MVATTLEQLKNDSKFILTLHKCSQYTLLLIAFFLPISTSLTNILFYLTALLILLTYKWSFIKNTIRDNKIAMSLVVLWILFTIGITYSQATTLESALIWKKHAKLIIAPLFCCLFITNNKLVISTIKLFILSMLITCFLGYLKVFELISVDGIYGSTSVFKPHIQTGILLAYTSYVLLVLSKYSIFMTNKLNTCNSRKHFIVYILLFSIVTTNILFFSTGRTGYVICFILITLFLFRCLPDKWTIILLVLVSTMPLMLYNFSESFKNRIDLTKAAINKFQNDEDNITSVGLRISFLQNGLKIIQSNPIYGSGTGSIELRYKQIEKNTKLLTDNPHNEYLNIGIQLGIFGLVYLLLMLAYHWYKSTLLPPPYNLLTEGLVLTIVIGSLANSLLMDTTESHFYVYFLLAYFGTYLNKKTL